MSDSSTLLKIVQSWNISSTPEYRGFRCAYCQEYQNQSWHHWLKTDGFVVPIHLCNEKCHMKFVEGTFSFKKTSTYQKNPLSNNYSEKMKEIFEKITSAWDTTEKAKLKPFSCDLCHQELTIDSSDALRKGYHVWYETKNGDYAELHFHQKCFSLLREEI